MRVSILGKNGPKIVNMNRRKAIRERCLICSGWVLKDVTECEYEDCSLYPFRSGKGKQHAKARAKAIRKYCLWCMVGSRYEVKKCVCPDCPLYPYRNSKVDKSVEIQSLPENEHIEAILEDKN